MSEQNYVEVKPKHCSKCGKDYTPIVHSDECPHNKVDVSEQDELLLPNVIRIIRENYGRIFCLDGKEKAEKVAPEILAKAKQHYEQKIRELRIEVGSIAFEKGKKYFLDKGLDRPKLREKIKDIVLKACLHFEKGDDEQLYGSIKQILALIPDIEEEREKVAELIKGLLTPEEAQRMVEEAKKQERERVIVLLETKNLTELRKRWQALKETEGGKG